MLPDRVSKPGPLTYKSGALPIALHGLATEQCDRRLYRAIEQIDSKQFILNVNQMCHITKIRIFNANRSYA